MDELAADAHRARAGGVPYGIVWQSARYEGLVTSFVEFLGAFGGRILADDGTVVVDSPEGIRALTFMRDLITSGAAPTDILTWHEEESRFAFQNGAAAMMRNWPYAVTLLKQPRDSRVAGKFGVAPMPGAAGGAPTATLGGSALAINGFTAHPDAAWKVVEFLTAPEQMLDRSRLSGYPPAPRSMTIRGSPRSFRFRSPSRGRSSSAPFHVRRRRSIRSSRSYFRSISIVRSPGSFRPIVLCTMPPAR